MPDSVYNRDVLADLRRQHDDLRALIGDCDAAAAEVERTGSRQGHPLVRAATSVLEALSRHNLIEERQLRTLLRQADAYGEVRVGQMIEDHIAEHAAIASALRDVVLIEDASVAARAVRIWLARIRGHIETEERQFLNDRVLRDDLVAIDVQDG